MSYLAPLAKNEREAVITELVKRDMEQMGSEGVEELLRKGCKGYDDFSDEMLLKFYNE